MAREWQNNDFSLLKSTDWEGIERLGTKLDLHENLITPYINLTFFFSFAKTSRLYTLPSVQATFSAVYAFSV